MSMTHGPVHCLPEPQGRAQIERFRRAAHGSEAFTQAVTSTFTVTYFLLSTIYAKLPFHFSGGDDGICIRQRPSFKRDA